MDKPKLQRLETFGGDVANFPIDWDGTPRLNQVWMTRAEFEKLYPKEASELPKIDPKPAPLR